MMTTKLLWIKTALTSDYKIDLEAIEAKITDKTALIYICNPNNPTGHLYSEEEMKQLAVIVKKHDLFLIADEVYREFIYDGNEHYSILREPNLENNAIVIDSVSKSNFKLIK